MNDVEDLIEEIEEIVYGSDATDWEGQGFIDNPSFKVIDKVYHNHQYEGDMYFRWIFEYKGCTFSVVKNDNSYGDRGIEWGTLKEVYPVLKTMLVYE